MCKFSSLSCYKLEHTVGVLADEKSIYEKNLWGKFMGKIYGEKYK